MSTAPTFSARLLGQTEKAANAILDRLLAEPGLTEPQWVALTLGVASGGTVERDEFVNRVSGALKIGEARAQSLLAELAVAQLLDVPDDGHAPPKVTDAGQQVYGTIRVRVGEVTDRRATCRPRTWRPRAASSAPSWNGQTQSCRRADPAVSASRPKTRLGDSVLRTEPLSQPFGTR